MYVTKHIYIFFPSLRIIYFVAEYPSAPYDELLRAAGVGGLSPCPEPVRLPGDPCRPNQRSIAFKPATITKMLQIKTDDKFTTSSSGSASASPCGKRSNVINLYSIF